MHLFEVRSIKKNSDKQLSSPLNGPVRTTASEPYKVNPYCFIFKGGIRLSGNCIIGVVRTAKNDFCETAHIRLIPHTVLGTNASGFCTEYSSSIHKARNIAERSANGPNIKFDFLN